MMSLTLIFLLVRKMDTLIYLKTYSFFHLKVYSHDYIRKSSLTEHDLQEPNFNQKLTRAPKNILHPASIQPTAINTRANPAYASDWTQVKSSFCA